MNVYIVVVGMFEVFMQCLLGKDYYMLYIVGVYYVIDIVFFIFCLEVEVEVVVVEEYFVKVVVMLVGEIKEWDYFVCSYQQLIGICQCYIYFCDCDFLKKELDF